MTDWLANANAITGHNGKHSNPTVIYDTLFANAPSGVVAYGPTNSSQNDDYSGYPQLNKLNFASPGSVDTNFPLRLQYETNTSVSLFEQNFGGGTSPGPERASASTLTAAAFFRFTQAERQFNLLSYYNALGAAMFVARADAFAPGVTPTPSQILALGSSLICTSVPAYIRSGTSNAYDPAFDDEDLYSYHVLKGPYSTQLSPGTKYWVLVMPVLIVDYRQPASVANCKPLGGAVPNTIGRAVSVWTNRPPDKPTIVSPASGISAPPNSTFSLTYAPADPDTIFGGTPWDSKYYLFTDQAGVQVQYAPRPTVDNPNPTWTDLPITNNAGTSVGPGWAIRDSTAIPATSGSFNLLKNGTIAVRAGSNVLHANEGVLPGGDWQIRLRTFDYGHAAPKAERPLGYRRAANTLTPDAYPTYNVSAWSDPVVVSVPAQVPPPNIITPNNDIALADSLDVTLTWQYRNTATPPFPQAHRLVQYREVGAPTWITLVDENSALSTVTLPHDSLHSTTEYEWRVQVIDSDGKVSNFSPIGRFWIVATPASGGTRPVPSSTIDGATLGCGEYRVFVFRRGGLKRVGEIKNISHLDWGRVRDDISDAKIVVSGWDIDCGNLLSKLQCWAYEIVIFRYNGFTVDRVWEGPITLLTYEKESVTIQAKDVMGYAYRRIIKQKMTDSGTGNGTTVVNRAMRVLQNTLAPDDPNILPYLTVITQADDAMQYRSTPAYSRTAFEEVDDMAANAGLDYTTVGRAIMLWGTKHRIGTLPEFTDKDLGAPPIVSEYGMSMANRYVVSDGNGIWGEATRLDVSGNDNIYGLVEMLSSSWASDSPDDSGTYTQAGLATVVESFKGFAERSIADRYGPGSPVVVRIPDNTTLNPSAVVSIQQLVPGVAIPLRSTSTLRSVVGTQKLDSVKIVVEGGKEAISITVSPFSRDDQSAVEGDDV